MQREREKERERYLCRFVFRVFFLTHINDHSECVEHYQIEQNKNVEMRFYNAEPEVPFFSLLNNFS